LPLISGQAAEFWRLHVCIKRFISMIFSF